ncbi:MAG: DUF885 domain-containing protein [Acidobacteria bacterium]|nr:MAG: DUF885 domain-containing protein [Acidobacteriota bacterium]
MVLSLLVAGGVLAIQTIYFKPISIDLFFERVFIEMALRDPELLTELGLPAPLRFFNDELTDASPAHDLALARQLRRDLQTLERYRREHLDPQRRLSYDVLHWWLAEQVRGEPFLWHDFPVNQVIGPHSYLPTFMATVHPLRDRRDAEDYVARLSKVRRKFDQLIENLRWREAQGIRPPRFMIERVIDELDALAAGPARHSVFYTGLADRLPAVEGLSEQERAGLLAAAERQVEGSVLPAYRALSAYFAELLPKVATDHGAWAQPDGLAYYAQRLRLHTSTDLSAVEIHALGLREVERLEAEMASILAHLGYAGEPVGTLMAELAREERFRFPAGDPGRDEILDRLRRIVAQIGDALPASAFPPDLRAPVGITVARIPPFTEATTPSHYRPAGFDGSRDGVFYVNLRDAAGLPRFRLKALAYHETIPGHHLQYGIQLGLADLPTFRRVLPFAAYAEGWALYAEQLAWELGFLDDPYDNLGRLQAELARAVRLVADTGLHHDRWTRQQAIDYLVATAGLTPEDATLEVERYLVAPGQACAYTIGKLKFVELRERMRRALGEDFSLAEFHRLVLANGALPLELLERVVDEHLARRLDGAGAVPADRSVR